MQLLEDECKDKETIQQQQQTNVTQDKQQPQSPQQKMDKFYPPKPKINTFNELFTCYLCQGYIINPTTIDVCTHTYCRSCIARHLAGDCFCPQCGKAITISNLQSDDILRSIIFKLVPGLYQKERERLVQFVNNTKNEGKLIGATEQSLKELLDTDDDLFSPSDPISVSLEFHPVLAAQCPEGSVPPVRYLQCPASVKVQHLKRFLCSKFEIDPNNSRVGIDIIYEDEILPSDFALMDVAYCYKWQRHAPLKLTYRILIYNDGLPPKSDNSYVLDETVPEKSFKSNLEKSLPTGSTLSETVSIVAEKTKISLNGDKGNPSVQLSPIASHPPPTPPQKIKVKSSKSFSSKHSSLHTTSFNQEVPVKVTISRKPSESKKSVSRKSSSTDDFAIPTTTNDFKSLRSNDIRFCDYTITSSTTNTINANTHTTLANSTAQSSNKREKPLAIKEEKHAKCDIVVSIPHNQMQEEWESKPLSQLKTASKKSPNSSCTEVADAAPLAKKVRNVPKLKIELNSLKTKLIEKPKSADIRLDTLIINKHHHHRPRKFSLEEPQPVMDKVDLETYVKNIGLKPIEIQTTNKAETTEKYTPNASPMSSSSSTTSSSTSNFNFNCSSDLTCSSSSFHKKRKKKHSKDSRESKDSKRKKMHAEISSHSAEESLKMKVKLTPPINLKSLKLESKKSPPFCMDKVTDPLSFEKSRFSSKKMKGKDFEKPLSPEGKHHERTKEKSKSRSSESKKSKSPDRKFFPDTKKSKDLEKSKPLEVKISASNNSSKALSKEFDDDEDLIIPDSTSLSLSKSIASMKETMLPHSPPLPPSLFKTTPLTFSTFSPNVTTVAKPKPVAMPKDSKDKPKTPHMKPIAPKPTGPKAGSQSSSSFQAPHFAVPNPPRFMASNTTKFLSTPTSIASAANKHMGNLLKRSISLDDNKNSGPLNKQQKLEKPNQITVSAYGSNLHMTKVEIPATPTSSTAKATYDIPLYSPLSASYNPKCSFSVNSTTTAVKSTKATLQNTMTSSATPAPTAKHTATANAVATNKTDVDVKKATTYDIKPLPSTPPFASANTMANTNNKTSATATATTPIKTVMGPPMSMQKLNSTLTAVPTKVKSPPLSSVLPFASTSTLNSTPLTAQHTPVLNTSYLSSPLSMVNYRQSKVLLAHVKPTNLPEMKIEKTTSTTNAATVASTTTTTTKSSVVTTNGLATEKPKSSLRQFRLPSRESGQDVLDLTSSKQPTNCMTEMQQTKPSTTATPTTNTHMITSAGNSLEMALNKIKQNMTTTTTTTSNNASSSTINNGVKKQELLSPISDDLQNLHLLSESATAREKIAISTSTSSSTSPSTSLYEKAKITQNSLVRQQNASVRNIPNPSALAFRNQQPATIIPPMVTIAAGLATTLTDLDKPLLLKTPSPPKSPHSPNCTTSSSSPSRTASKKHPSIDQVAASLNQRASAAAQAFAKANSKHTDETALVSSTSSSLMDKMEKKEIKLESTEMVSQNEAISAQPSSTVNNTCPLVNVLDIKKEPEDKMEDVPEVKPPTFINATTKKSSMVENLVTSVINVTTPTSKMLTATTAAGF